MDDEHYPFMPRCEVNEMAQAFPDESTHQLSNRSQRFSLFYQFLEKVNAGMVKGADSSQQQQPGHVNIMI
ncbi:hypothetical protein TNCV_4625451 [Trichonephila clavipes]|nr:hypothetical protein TNCV_4625451 [Trichonephila clavipes]